jgi:hypothetical protein
LADPEIVLSPEGANNIPKPTLVNEGVVWMLYWKWVFVPKNFPTTDSLSSTMVSDEDCSLTYEVTGFARSCSKYEICVVHFDGRSVHHTLSASPNAWFPTSKGSFGFSGPFCS